MAVRPGWRRATGALAGLALAALLAPGLPAADDGAPAAADQLARRYKLVKITGRVWGLPQEQQLRAQLKRLPQLRERIVTAQNDLDERVARNDAAWKVAGPLIAAIEQQLEQVSTSDPRRGPLVEQLARLNAEAVKPADLAGRDAVRSRLAQLGQDRCTLALALVGIRTTAAAIAGRYRELAGDAEVKRLVRESGEKCRLGPARNYQAEVRKLGEYDALAFAPQAPMYLQSGKVRVTAIVNDAACVTFSWSEASDAVTYLPQSVLRTAGIEIPADARIETLRIGGRTIEAREVFIPSLRVGSCQAKSVAALVLPPEAEDLGAQLTPLALSPWRAKVERERLRMALIAEP